MQVNIHNFTKLTSHAKIERLLKDKTKSCKVKAKIIQYGRSEENCEFLKNQKIHELNCEELKNPIDTIKFNTLLSLKIKPSHLIKEYNKTAILKIQDNEVNRRKITQKRYTENQKSKPTNEIVTMSNFKEWIHLHDQSFLNNENFNIIDWNLPFVTGYSFERDNFITFCTTKNLIYNITKQVVAELTYICCDGTYKLNQSGFPTIVVGTVDLHRKFHLSKKL